MRKRIAVDMDEVIADSLARHIAWYNKAFNRSITREELNGAEFVDYVPEEHRASVADFPREETFFEDLPVIEGSREVVARLAEKYEVFIATAAMEYPNSFKAKYEWLEKHFSFIPWTHIVFCGDKGVIAADYLIDDHASHFENFGGEGILFTSPHNIGQNDYRRVDNWKEVAEFFL